MNPRIILTFIGNRLVSCTADGQVEVYIEVPTTTVEIPVVETTIKDMTSRLTASGIYAPHATNQAA